MFGKLVTGIKNSKFVNFIKMCLDDNINIFAADTAFFMFSSLFSFMIIIFFIVQNTFLPTHVLWNVINTIVPDALDDVVKSLVFDFYKLGNIKWFSITAIAIIWSSSRGFKSIYRALTAINELTETEKAKKVKSKQENIQKKEQNIKKSENFLVDLKVFLIWLWKFIKGVVINITFALLVILTIAAYFFSKKFALWFFDKINYSSDFWLNLVDFRTLGIFAILFVFTAMLYMYAPFGKRNKDIPTVPGTLFTVLSWFLFTFIYSLYLDHSMSNNVTYGSLTSVIFFMMWLYFCSLIMYVGAEINKYLYKNKCTKTSDIFTGNVFNRIKNDFKKYKRNLLIALAVFIILNIAFGNVCMSIALLDIPCPACGLTRAGLYLLCGDFALAWSMNPCIYLIAAFLIYCFIMRYCLGKEKIKGFNWILLGILAALFIVYGIRMCVYYPDVEAMFHKNY